LITGHVLPKLPGLRLVQKLRAARMALPVVLVAKELPLAELARGPSLQLAAMLVKPVAVEVLVDTVRSVLRATSRPFEHIAARAATITPMLQEILERNNDYSHWGLNE
jgi:DNA-binding response OmpR family regulator